MSGSNPAAGGFSPGTGMHGVQSAPIFADAADLLNSSTPDAEADSIPGVLLLADGSRFEGTLIGACDCADGELVFTTGMSGFQESLTDPSFAGQVLTFTYPLIGNYGVHLGRSESSGVWPRGVVVRHAIKEPDHRDSLGSLSQFLKVHGVTGIEGVDTRAVTKRVREYGTVLCTLGPLEMEEELSERLSNLTAPDLEDLVDEVSIDSPVILNEGVTDDLGKPLPRIAAIDCGIKYNILRELCKRFEVIWCPPDTPFEQMLNEWRIDALFCSNGPGDPAHPGKATMARNSLAQGVAAGIPVMGICLGHQLLGLASGLQTYKMRYGHRGANQPVVDLVTGKVSITSQNHGFAVADPDAGMLAAHPSGACSELTQNLHGAQVSVRFVNANDRTVEGLDVIDRPVFSVQYHPEACPGPHDASPLFNRFSDIVNDYLGGVV